MMRVGLAIVLVAALTALVGPSLTPYDPAAQTLAQLVTKSDLEQGSLYPALPRIREVSAHIAAAVADIAYKNGLAGKPRPEDVLADVRSQMFDPHY